MDCVVDWARDLPTWSHPGLSRRVTLGRHQWHVQEAGAGDLIMLLPGAGASTHTWRDMIPILADTYRVVAVDMPGQGFSKGPSSGMGLPEMGQDLGRLLDLEGWRPRALIGHSAGAAIGLELARHRAIPTLIGINPALANFQGAAEWLFPMMAKLLALNPLTATIFTKSVSPARAEKLILGTGSQISAEGLGYYLRLMQNRSHVNGALTMMASWSLKDLTEALPSIETEVLFITGAKDKAVPPEVAQEAAAKMKNARTLHLEGLGHLMHEEAPQRLCQIILEALRA